jgi:gliding motility-associated transport system permease protein
MRNTLAIAKREFSSYFNSPIPFILVGLFVAIASYLFLTQLFVAQQADMRPFFELMPLLFCVLVPLLTMRLLAEEKREGTLELLLTMPISDWQLVIGKYLAVLGIIAVLLLVTVAVPLTVASVGPLDKGATFATYVGAFLMAGSYAAVGLMASSLTRNQIVAAILGVLLSLILFLVGMLVASVPPSIGVVVAAIGITPHFNNIARGVIDSRDVLYFLSLIFVCLLIAQTSLDSRRWR